VVKSINILIALSWVAKAWSLTRAETIARCFRKAGVLNADPGVISCDLEEEDNPFLEAKSYGSAEPHREDHAY